MEDEEPRTPLCPAVVWERPCRLEGGCGGQRAWAGMCVAQLPNVHAGVLEKLHNLLSHSLHICQATEVRCWQRSVHQEGTEEGRKERRKDYFYLEGSRNNWIQEGLCMPHAARMRRKTARTPCRTPLSASTCSITDFDHENQSLSCAREDAGKQDQGSSCSQS